MDLEFEVQESDKKSPSIGKYILHVIYYYDQLKFYAFDNV